MKLFVGIYEKFDLFDRCARKHHVGHSFLRYPQALATFPSQYHVVGSSEALISIPLIANALACD